MKYYIMATMNPLELPKVFCADYFEPSKDNHILIFCHKNCRYKMQLQFYFSVCVYNPETGTIWRHAY